MFQSDPDRPGALTLLGMELRHLVRGAWRTFSKVGIYSAVALFPLLLGVFLWELPKSTEFSFLDIPFATLCYAGLAAYIGVQLGMLAALARTLWDILGLWILYPLVIAPPLFILVLLLFSPLLVTLGAEVADALAARAVELDHMIPGDVGVAARTPLGAVLAIAYLLVGTGMYLASWKVSLAVLAYLLTIATLLATYAIVVLSFTLPVLLYVWFRRIKRRHSS